MMITPHIGATQFIITGNDSVSPQERCGEATAMRVAATIPVETR